MVSKSLGQLAFADIEDFDTIPTGTKELRLILKRSPHDAIVRLQYGFLNIYHLQACFLLKELHLLWGRLL